MPEKVDRSVLALGAPDPIVVRDIVDGADSVVVVYAESATLEALGGDSPQAFVQGVTLEGEIGSPGAECVVGDTVIIESVATSEAAYFPTLGPTYFTQDSADDLAALESAGIRFRETGELPAFLLLPQGLTEMGAWAGVSGLPQEWRTTVRAERGVTRGIGSPTVDAGSAIPFLMAAAVAARRLSGGPAAPRFSGAGMWWNSLADLGEVAPRPALPAILASVESRAVVVNLMTLRAYAIGVDAAWLLELLLWGDRECLMRTAVRRDVAVAELLVAAEQVAAGVGLAAPALAVS
jgi:hypothetical protein